MCSCKWWDWVLVILVIVFTFWTLSFSKWIVLVAGILLFVSKYTCNCCDASGAMPKANTQKTTPKPMPKKK